MNISDRTIRILGTLVLMGFVTTVAAVYWDLPARLSTAATGRATEQKLPVASVSPAAAPAGRCPVYHGQMKDAMMTAAQAESGGSCCRKQTTAHQCQMESASCEHAQAAGAKPSPSDPTAKPAVAAEPSR